MASKVMTFPVDIELSEKKVRYICDQFVDEMTDGQKIAGLAEDAISQMGEGGMVISGNVMNQIRDLIGDFEEQDLVRYIEAGKGMQDGKLIIPWTPDPTYVPVLEDTANKQGLPVQRVAQDLMDYAAANNWLYDMAPDVVVTFFTRDDFRAICESFDREHVTGTDLAAFIKSLAEAQPEQEEKHEELVQEEV